MARVSFTENLQRHLFCPTTEGKGETVLAVLNDVFHTNQTLRTYILDDQGRLRQHIAVFVNDRPVSDRELLSDRVTATDDVFVFQALSGG